MCNWITYGVKNKFKNKTFKLHYYRSLEQYLFICIVPFGCSQVAVKPEWCSIAFFMCTLTCENSSKTLLISRAFLLVFCTSASYWHIFMIKTKIWK